VLDIQRCFKEETEIKRFLTEPHTRKEERKEGARYALADLDSLVKTGELRDKKAGEPQKENLSPTFDGSFHKRQYLFFFFFWWY
jgi:hypothetical protein